MLSILTVDDESHIHKGLDAIINWEALGCTHAYSAGNGAEALDLIQKNRPDIILTDIKMPVMDGIELISRIRAIDGYHPAVIIMSGYNDFEYAQAALRNEVNDYLLKPVDEEELSACITKIVSRKRVPGSGLPGDMHTKAAASTIFRRLASSEGTCTKEEMSLLFHGHTFHPPYAFALIAPFDTPHGGYAEQFFKKLQEALSVFRDKIACECMYRDTGGAVGVMFGGRLINTAHTPVNLAMEGFYREITALLGMQLKIILGIPVDYLTMISESRQSVLELISGNYVMFSPGVEIAARERVRQTSMVRRESIDRVMRLVDENDIDGAAKGVSDFFAAARKEGISSDALREWLHLLMHEVQNLVNRLGGEEVPAGSRLIDSVKKIELTPAPVLLEAAEEYLRAACNTLLSLRISLRHSNVVLIKRAIERRSSEELTLGALSQDLDMNPVYLGQMFKQVIGKSFKDYLREIRIKEACRLLRETNERIGEIAGKVGYNSYDYFVEQFKRECGVTPSSYRRK